MSPSATPVVMIALSASAPHVRSITNSAASSRFDAVCVAPNSSACSRLNATGSTTITCRAPAMAAPCTALMPTPPQPTMTTVSPGCTSAAYVAEPQPVVTPQPTSAALSRGMSSSILMQLASLHDRVRRERADAAHDPEVLAALGVMAGGEVGDLPSGEQERRRGRTGSAGRVAHDGQRPHEGMKPRQT